MAWSVSRGKDASPIALPLKCARRNIFARLPLPVMRTKSASLRKVAKCCQEKKVRGVVFPVAAQSKGSISAPQMGIVKSREQKRLFAKRGQMAKENV